MTFLDHTDKVFVEGVNVLVAGFMRTACEGFLAFFLTPFWDGELDGHVLMRVMYQETSSWVIICVVEFGKVIAGAV